MKQEVQSVQLHKEEALRLFCILVQAAKSVHRSLPELPEGWDILRTYYERGRKRHLQEMIQLLQQRSPLPPIQDRTAVRSQREQSCPAWLDWLAPLLRLLARARKTFSLPAQESAFILSALNEMLWLLDRSEPPSIPERRQIASDMMRAALRLETWCWCFPELQRASRIEYLHQGSASKWYTMEEVLGFLH